MTGVLLTGAAGVQASYIIHRLRAKYDLTLFDRAAPREEFSDLPFISGDITRLEDEKTEFAEADLFYSLAKNLGEAIGNAYHQAHGLDVIHLRPGVIARDGANAEPQPTDAPFWFIHVDPEDVAHAVEAALQSETRHGTFQIVAGRS